MQVTHTRGAILEKTHYYPFGLTIAGISSKAAGGVENKAKYNGIEKLDDFGLELYDAYFREHDPQIGRWLQIDPKADEEDFESWSPYNNNFDNPVCYFDFLGDEPDGWPPKWMKDAGNWIAKNADNIADAAGTLDPTGVIDGIHGITYAIRGDYGNAKICALSILPGGDIAKAAKYVNKAVDAVKAVDKAKDVAKVVDKANDTKKTFQTYTKQPKNPADGVFSGNTSGKGTP